MNARASKMHTRTQKSGYLQESAKLRAYEEIKAFIASEYWVWLRKHDSHPPYIYTFKHPDNGMGWTVTKFRGTEYLLAIEQLLSERYIRYYGRSCSSPFDKNPGYEYRLIK